MMGIPQGPWPHERGLQRPQGRDRRPHQKRLLHQYQARVDRKSPSGEDENGNRRSVKDRLTEIHVISGGRTRGGSIHSAKASLKK